MSLRFEKTMDEKDASQLNAIQLAYLGDTVWEMIVRYKLISHKYNVRHMHKRCVSLVNAHSQYTILGSNAKARASPARFFIPPLISAGSLRR